jgi:hypothetical protein
VTVSRGALEIVYLLMILSSLLRHLLSYIQPSEERFLRRKPPEVIRRSPDVDGRCHCRYACCISHHTLRCHQDSVTSRGTKGRGGIYRPPARCADHLPGGGIQGFLQGWTSSYHAFVAAVRLHTSWIRSIAARYVAFSGSFIQTRILTRTPSAPNARLVAVRVEP